MEEEEGRESERMGRWDYIERGKDPGLMVCYGVLGPRPRPGFPGGTRKKAQPTALPMRDPRCGKRDARAKVEYRAFAGHIAANSSLQKDE